MTSQILDKIMEYQTSTVISIVLGSGVTLLVLRSLLSKRSSLPAGPKTLPLIGNVHQLPTQREWLTYAKWSETYGDMFTVFALSQPIVLLNTYKIVNDLFDKRSGIYSSRARLVMAGELVGFERSLALMPYGKEHPRIRRLVHKQFTGAAVQTYHPLHEQQSRVLVANLLADPADSANSVRHYVGSLILRVLYGYQAESTNDKYLDWGDKVNDSLSRAATPGVWLVDIMPFLRYVPSWMPGASFQHTAAKWKKYLDDLIHDPYRWSKANQGNPAMIKPNFVSSQLAAAEQEGGLSPEDEYTLTWASGSMLGGGTDTTVAAISSFILAMGLHPEIQKRAQAEVDAITGGKHLPLASDRPKLPYIEGLMWEVLRWNPVVPLGLPHLLTQDDAYEGYMFPKGTIFIPNIWSMLHDPALYPEPEAFNPERFLNNPKALNFANVAFGFGRRFCPGSVFAEAELFVAIVTILATCDISNPIDASGAPVKKDVPWLSGIISHPDKYTCTIKPRDKHALELLLEHGDYPPAVEATLKSMNKI